MTTEQDSQRFGTLHSRVVIAGGGVAGLETLMALRALAGARVELTLVAPHDEFVYRPLAVDEPFAVGRARRIPLDDAARATEATFISGTIDAVDADQRIVTPSDSRALEYDALVLAVGAEAVPAVAHAMTWDDRSDAETLGGLLRDNHDRRPRSVASAAARAARCRAGLRRARAGRGGRRVHAEVEAGHAATVVLHPSGSRLEVDRVLALPGLRGRPIAGIPADADGFVEVDEHGRLRGLDGVWGVGDATA